MWTCSQPSNAMSAPSFEPKNQQRISKNAGKKNAGKDNAKNDTKNDTWKFTRRHTRKKGDKKEKAKKDERSPRSEIRLPVIVCLFASFQEGQIKKCRNQGQMLHVSLAKQNEHTKKLPQNATTRWQNATKTPTKCNKNADKMQQKCNKNAESDRFSGRARRVGGTP